MAEPSVVAILEVSVSLDTAPVTVFVQPSVCFEFTVDMPKGTTLYFAHTGSPFNRWYTMHPQGTHPAPPLGLPLCVRLNLSGPSVPPLYTTLACVHTCYLSN